MTLVYKRDVGEGPALHAFVVGCGFFPGLAEWNADRQCCADSARTFAEFLIANADKFRAPLGSVEVLISDPGQDNTLRPFPPYDRRSDTKVDNANWANVDSSAVAWMLRCRPDDHLLFYGCSHGVTDRDQSALMLLEDVRSNTFAPWEKALNVGDLASFLPAATKAGACWIFLDACQELRDDIVEEIKGVTGLQVAKATVRQMRATNVRSVSLAAAPYGKLAYAPSRGVAYFTSALLEGLQNCCVEATSNGWEVSSNAILMGAIKNVADVAFGQDVSPESLNAAPSSNYYLMTVDDPKLPVMITAPASLLAMDVEVTCGNDPAMVKPDGADAAWRIHVPLRASPVKIRATLDGSRNVQQEVALRPPCLKVELK